MKIKASRQEKTVLGYSPWMYSGDATTKGSVSLKLELLVGCHEGDILNFFKIENSCWSRRRRRWWCKNEFEAAEKGRGPLRRMIPC